jgi:hypothetical protein
MKVTGACHCRNIQFTAEVDVSHVVLCHCTDCQTLSGSAFRVNAPAPFESFNLLCGEPKTYMKVAEGGSKRLHGFCGDCGTPLYSVAPVGPTIIFLRLGAIHERHLLSPALQIWCRSTVCWLNELDSIPGSPEQQALAVK